MDRDKKSWSQEFKALRKAQISVVISDMKCHAFDLKMTEKNQDCGENLAH